MKKVFLRPGLISSLVFIVFATACGKGSQTEEVSLPFYNSAEFTPEWINEPSDQQIHTIADFEFLNQNGKKVSNKSLEGKIYVADFFFTICPSICPKMTSNLSRVQEAFESDAQVQLVSYSVMPWVDSVSVLKDYAEVKGISAKKWNLLTGEKEDIYELARTSYFAEKEIGLTRGSGDFLHTENFILIDGKGRIRGVYNGTLALEVVRLVADIKTLKKLG